MLAVPVKATLSLLYFLQLKKKAKRWNKRNILTQMITVTQIK